jgi:hypothetical protein
MKTNRLFSLAFISAFQLLSVSVFAQGSLTPPGAPAPTMKALDQVEPRKLIAGGTAAVTISQAGSYYLTGNITVAAGDAITIATNGVTLDLMGFTISSTANPAAGSGIVINSLLKNITILNGNILGAVTFTGSTFVGAGFQNGINVPSGGIAPRNVRISGVSVAGCTLNGIYLGDILQNSAAVDHCLVRTIGSAGIQAGTVTACAVSECGGAAINCFIASDSSGDANSSLTGISAKTAVNCVGTSATGTGLSAESATGCRGESTGGSGTGTGLSAFSANGCYGLSNAGTGLNATTASGCWGQSAGSGIGLNAIGASNSSGTSSSNSGLSANSASNCYGNSNSGIGLDAGFTAIGCYGFSSSGTGLRAYIANSSVGLAGVGGVANQTINFKYNMP